MHVFRALKEEFEKQKAELTYELEAQKMQIVADQERIESLVERNSRVRAVEARQHASSNEDCIMCHEYEREVCSAHEHDAEHRITWVMQISRLQTFLKQAETISSQAETSVANAIQVDVIQCF